MDPKYLRILYKQFLIQALNQLNKIGTLATGVRIDRRDFGSTFV